MKEIDRLLYKARMMVCSIRSILFYSEGICNKCGKDENNCTCKLSQGENIIIDFVRCRSREEAKKWMEQKEEV